MAREKRKLAAIVAADVVGYSRLMGRDESGTLARLRKHRAERLDPVLAKYGGRLVKLTGDGALIEFTSAVDALSASIEFQQGMAEANQDQPADAALLFRMGLHLGDLIVDGDDLYGDGVNVAARLEAEAPAGGIVVSRTVHEAVTGRVKATFDNLGNLALKNIERPVQAFSVTWVPSDWPPTATAEAVPAQAAPLSVALPLPDKPSIAVLPFQNMSGDLEQEYFADGVVEDIITALSRFKSLFVIARNSSFTYKGRTVDIKQVGRELGVRYVLEGSVRKAANRVRITAQLVETDTAVHRWAERFNGPLEDIFELQDDVTRKVVTALVPTLERAEIARAARAPTNNLDAYDRYLRGLAAEQPPTKENYEVAKRLFEQALELDPGYTPALGKLLGCYAQRRAFGAVTDDTLEKKEVARLVQLAVHCDDGVALGRAAWNTAYILGDLPSAKEQIERALALNPNAANSLANRGWLNLWSGDAGRALEDLSRSMRLDPIGGITLRNGLAHAYFFLGRYEKAMQWADHQLRENPQAHAGLRIAAASAALAGKLKQAQLLGERLRQADPSLTVGRLQKYLGPYQAQDYVEVYKQGLRLAGLPE